MPFYKYFQNMTKLIFLFILAIPDIELPDEAFSGPLAKV